MIGKFSQRTSEMSRSPQPEPVQTEERMRVDQVIGLIESEHVDLNDPRLMKRLRHLAFLLDGFLTKVSKLDIHDRRNPMGGSDWPSENPS
jgi:hypothetical protein